ncbi:IS701 family transposase [Dendronalium sp. ChiSLP03b]|uniref:IS701 family transposase n=1 Tax=Dendronalium sp. ChiSLP03b TaxID=3075381 RepID=UPI00391CA1C8
MTQPRSPKPSIKFVDEYCAIYKNIFPEVRSFENFRDLHLGMISEIKRKSLPEIAKVVGLENQQSLHHFLTESPWSVESLKKRRLELILRVLNERSLILIIDETGDKKQGRTTDYVKRQYIGNLGKIENGIVAVTAYGVIEDMTLPLTFQIYKPRERLQLGDKYKTKPEIAAELIRELQGMGFKFELVLADSLYGESDGNFISVLNQLELHFVVAIRSNHGVWLPKGQSIRYNKWRQFDRVFSNGHQEIRYIREIIFGRRRDIRYWQITTDTEKLPENSTWFLMTHVPGIKYSEVGNLYGLRTWVEYGLKQSKNELGWADFRLTHYSHIQRWWEIVCSTYLMVSLHSSVFQKSHSYILQIFAEHPLWDESYGWKNILNNLRLIIQPLILFNLIKPWLKVFSIPQLSTGFSDLISIMNTLHNHLFLSLWSDYFSFSSA